MVRWDHILQLSLICSASSCSLALLEPNTFVIILLSSWHYVSHPFWTRHVTLRLIKIKLRDAERAPIGTLGLALASLSHGREDSITDVSPSVAPCARDGVRIDKGFYLFVFPSKGCTIGPSVSGLILVLG